MLSGLRAALPYPAWRWLAVPCLAWRRWALPSPLLQCLNGAGARGDDRRDATSERFGDDQAKRLDSGREYEQIGGIPSLIESRAS